MGEHFIIGISSESTLISVSKSNFQLYFSYISQSSWDFMSLTLQYGRPAPSHAECLQERHFVVAHLHAEGSFWPLSFLDIRLDSGENFSRCVFLRMEKKQADESQFLCSPRDASVVLTWLSF